MLKVLFTVEPVGDLASSNILFILLLSSESVCAKSGYYNCFPIVMLVDIKFSAHFLLPKHVIPSAEELLLLLHLQ